MRESGSGEGRGSDRMGMKAMRWVEERLSFNIERSVGKGRGRGRN